VTTQNPVRFTPSVGSTPTSGTKFAARYADARTDKWIENPVCALRVCFFSRFGARGTTRRDSLGSAGAYAASFAELIPDGAGLGVFEPFPDVADAPGITDIRTVAVLARRGSRRVQTRAPCLVPIGGPAHETIAARSTSRLK